MESGEHYLDTLKRELMEAAGCELLSFELFGALRMKFFTDKPYRPHLPPQISYRPLGVGEVKRITSPTNPTDGEEILAVETFPLDEVCRLLAERPDDGPLLAEIYRLAAYSVSPG